VAASRSEPLPGLSAHHRALLLRVAREALETHLTAGRHPALHSDDPVLRAPRATFVTLRRRANGDLRGCRGETRPTRPLIDAVAYTTIASATDDPRFAPVTAPEIPSLAIEISVLTPLALIAATDVVVGRHGLMVEQRGRAGLLLPQVPLEQGWDRETFLRWVCRKAGLADDAWRAADTTLYGFETVAWAEKDATAP